MIFRVLTILSFLLLAGCASNKQATEQVEQASGYEQNSVSETITPKPNETQLSASTQEQTSQVEDNASQTGDISTAAASDEESFDYEDDELLQEILAEQEDEPLEDAYYDPFENFNRAMYDFNFNVLDKHIVRPVAVFYRDYIPEELRNGLYNMAENLDEPAAVVNGVLQLKIDEAAQNTGRFVINSTIGVLGFFDIAKEFGLERNQEDFGETLGVWGVGNGPYLMIPAYGPTAPRELVGDYVDGLYFPLNQFTFAASVVRWGIKALQARVALIEQEALLDASLDPYSFVKTAYFENIASRVADGKIEEEADSEEDLEAYLDEIDEEYE